jgi:WD40 repeat protein
VKPEVRVYDATPPPERFTVRSGGAGVQYVRLAAALGAEGRLLATAGAVAGLRASGGIQLWDTATGLEVRQMEGHAGMIRCVTFRPDGQQLATGADDHSVMTWDVATGQSLQTITGLKKPVLAVDYSPDGSRLASATEGLVHLHDPQSGETLWSRPGPAMRLVNSVALAFTPDGKQLAVATDGELGPLAEVLLLYNVQTGQRMVTPEGVTKVSALAFDPGGSRLATAGPGGAVQVWDLARGKPVLSLKAAGADPHRIQFDVAGNTLSLLDRTGRVDVLSAEDGKLIRSEPPRVVPGGAALVSDDRFVVTVDDGHKVRVWDRPR